MAADEPGGVRYRQDVGPGDKGMRISLRRRLPDGRYGDVLGVLLSWSDGLVRVERASGEIVEIAAADVVATKRVPPPPVRRMPPAGR